MVVVPRMRDLLSTFVITTLLAPVSILFIGSVDAQVMQSGNYRIQSDSINFGGGLSTSSSYTLESTGGEVATGESSSANYNLKAGYQQMQEVYIAITAAANVTMTPSLGGVTGGTAYGTTTTSVTTDGVAGYELSISAENEPAMQSGSDTIADYTPAGADPDFTFATDASDAHLAYSPEGNDVVQRFLDNGASCNTGSANAWASCWDGLATTTETIASATSANHPSGTATSILFRVGVGSAAIQAPGTYVATTTLTALPL